LATVTSAISLIDYSGTSLRYGLMDVRPVEITETVKRSGIKFLRTTRTFERTKAPETFGDFVKSQNQVVFDSIQIPERFDVDKLVEAFTQNAVENYENDEEFKKAVELLKESERKGRPLLSFVQFVKNRNESRQDEYLESEVDRFLRSNFPLSFYNRFVVFDSTYLSFLTILEDKVRRHEFLAGCARNFDMYKKRISEMKMAIGPLIDQIDICFLNYARLKKFVSIWNAEDYNEVLNPKFLDVKKVDYSELERVAGEYDMILRQTRGFFLNYDNEMLCKEIDPSESTAKMFSRILKLPSSALTLES
jgi:hypothetical protein